MTNIHNYWQQSLSAQQALLDSIEVQRAAEEAERVRVVGYMTTIEAPDSTMYPKQQDRDVIVCMECLGDPRDCMDEDRWDPISKEEYLDKKSAAFKATCADCGRELVEDRA